MIMLTFVCSFGSIVFSSLIAFSRERGRIMEQAQIQETRRDLTIPQAMHYAGIKSRATFDKYVLSLHIRLKKPGIGSKRYYISRNDAELLRQLKEMPERLDELKHSPRGEKDTSDG